MVYDVILRKQNNEFIAQAKEWPDVIARADTRGHAIDEVKKRLLDYLTNQVELVQVEIPLLEPTTNLWLEKFGWFKDDPTFDDWQAEIAKYRQEIDQETDGIVE